MTQIQKEETKISVITTNELKKKRININLKTFNKIVFSLILILGIYYIGGTNDLTVKGFELRDMKRHIKEVTNENSDLENRIVSLNSYKGLDSKVRGLGMVKADKVSYVRSGLDLVAKK